MKHFVQIRNLRLGEGRPKICVPLVGQKEEEIYQQARELLAVPADLVEWRADWFLGLKEKNRFLEVLRTLRQVLGERPVLFTIRTKGEGGEGQISFSEYQQLNLEAAQSGCVDLVDVEVFRMSVGQAEEMLERPDRPGNTELPENGQSMEKERATCMPEFLQKEGIGEFIRALQRTGVVVVGSSHDFEGTPRTDIMVECLRAMQELGVDICKLAVTPGEQADVRNLLEATWRMKTQYGDRPLITMSMGSLGVISRLAGELFGSSVTFGSVGKPSAPGQVEAGALAEYLELLHGGTEQETGNREHDAAAFPGHIFLIGFMGTGKSTVARMLKEQLHGEQVEMDACLEAQEGQSIASMFEQYGEAYFRDKETAFLYSLKGQTSRVVSCGGGVVTRGENRNFMKKHGKVVLLTARPETVLERVQGSQERPILNGNMNVEYIGQLMEKRQASYEAAADLTVSTDGKTVEEICQEIVTGLNALGGEE